MKKIILMAVCLILSFGAFAQEEVEDATKLQKILYPSALRQGHMFLYFKEALGASECPDATMIMLPPTKDGGASTLQAIAIMAIGMDKRVAAGGFCLNDRTFVALRLIPLK